MQLVQPSSAPFGRHRPNRERVDAGGDRHAPLGDIAPERLDLRLRVRELPCAHGRAMPSSSPLICVSTGAIRLISEPLPRESTLVVVAQYTYTTGLSFLASPHGPLVTRVHVGKAVPARRLRLGGRAATNQDRRHGGADSFRGGATSHRKRRGLRAPCR